MALTLQRINFDPVTGDNPSEGFQKLDNNMGELEDFLDDLNGELGLGDSATKDVGMVAGTVAAGDDARFARPGFRNLVINGGFDIWQRGTSFNTLGVYTADRWFSNCSGGVACVVARYAMPAGVIEGSGEHPDWAADITVTAGNASTSVAALLQKIEGVRHYAGKPVTVSFWAYATTAGKKLGVELFQNFGTGGSAEVNGISTSIDLATVWTYYTVTLTLPSIAGKTVGGSNFLGLNVWMNAGTTYTARSGGVPNQPGAFLITNIQVEGGSKASSFERLSASLELIRCQRYYEKSFNLGTPPANGQADGLYTGIGWSTTNARISTIPFKVQKRTSPTMTLYTSSGASSQQAGRWSLFNGSQYTTGVTTDVLGITEYGFYGNISVSSGLAFGQVYIVIGNWTADAEL